MLLFAKFNVFFIIDNQRGILFFPTRLDNYLAVHEESEHITYFRTYRSAWTVLYTIVFLFPLIDR